MLLSLLQSFQKVGYRFRKYTDIFKKMENWRQNGPNKQEPRTECAEDFLEVTSVLYVSKDVRDVLQPEEINDLRVPGIKKTGI